MGEKPHFQRKKAHKKIQDVAFRGDGHSGALAEASAQALEEAMDNTVGYIRNSSYFIGEYKAKRFFENELKRVFPLYIPGGRVQPRPNSRHVSTVTEYEASFFGNGNCD